MNESELYSSISLMNEDDFRKEIGLRIREVRKQKHLTLDELSKSSGVATSHLGAIERGKSTPSIFVCFKICNAMHISIKTLVELIPTPDTENRCQYPAQEIYNMIVSENTVTQLFIKDLVSVVINFNKEGKNKVLNQRKPV